MTDLGIYVFCKNEENLIVPCVKSLVDFFGYDRVTVVDLGSEDDTLKRLGTLGGVSLHKVATTPETYPSLKNLYAKNYEWAFLVDGDEIYPKESLIRVQELIDSKEFDAYRVGWKVLRYENHIISCTNIIINGCKLYKSSTLKFRRPWPVEVQHGPGIKEPKKDNGLWSWHGKLLNRSRIHTDKIREDKKENYPERLEVEHGVKWSRLLDYPWDSPEVGLYV